METITVKHGTISADVRTKYVRTALIEARYFQWLREQYPDIRKAEEIIARVTLPRVNGNADANDAAMQEYGEKLGQAFIEAQAEAGSALLTQAQRFVRWAARLHNLSGAAYALGKNAQFEKDALIQAFESSFDEEDTDDVEKMGFWGKVAKAITELDKPLTPTFQRPLEALTEAERNDPLSVSVTGSGSER